MRVLSLHQPWAWFVVYGFKAYETRSRCLRPVGELLIHATRKVCPVGRRLYYVVRGEFSDWMFEPFHPPPFDELPRGCIVGLVNHDQSMNLTPILSKLEAMLGNFSEGRWFYHFSNPRFFETPIPARGYQGLWRYYGDLPTATAAIKPIFSGQFKKSLTVDRNQRRPAVPSGTKPRAAGKLSTPSIP